MIRNTECGARHGASHLTSKLIIVQRALQAVPHTNQDPPWSVTPGCSTMHCAMIVYKQDIASLPLVVYLTFT